MDEIRIGIVGLGTRAVNEWMPMLLAIEGYRITAICDPVEGLHDRALSKLDCPDQVTVYTRYADVLSDPDVDAIALTVRCTEQGEMAALALDAGKHVHSEVVAANSIEDCWRIVLAQEKSGLVYHLHEQRRWSGFLRPWKRMVEEGQLGHITYAEGEYFHYYVGKFFQDPQTGQMYRPEEADAHPNAVPTDLHRQPPIHYIVHDISPLLFVLDDRVTEVTAMSTRPGYSHPNLGQPDMQVALMKTEKDTILRLAASFVQKHAEPTHWRRIVGTKGSIQQSRKKSNELQMLWLADSQMHDVAEVDWRHRPVDAPPESRETGHDGCDYFPQIAFRDAVLEEEPLEFDVYKAVDTAAAGIMAAESIVQATKLMHVPDFRPGKGRAFGEMP